MSPRVEGIAWASLVVLAFAAAYQALVALEIVGIRSEPGQGAPGGGIVFGAALLAFVAGAATSFRHALETMCARRLVWVALATPVGVGLLLARWFSFDPYFVPSLRRYSEGAVSGT